MRPYDATATEIAVWLAQSAAGNGKPSASVLVALDVPKQQGAGFNDENEGEKHRCRMSRSVIALSGT
jgi:hypothetical protein